MDQHVGIDDRTLICRRPGCGKQFTVRSVGGLTLQCRIDGYCTPSCEIAHAARVAMSPVQVSLARVRK